MNSAMFNPFGGFYIKNILKELEESNAKDSSLYIIDGKTDGWNLDDGLSVKIVDAPHNINETKEYNEGAIDEKK